MAILYDQKPFLQTVSGAAAQAFQAGDWSSSPLGPVASWSARLRFALEVVFADAQPMFVCWGEHHLLFHNDGCLAFGDGRVLLGRPLAEAWPEVAAVLVPVCERLHATGRGELLEDQCLLLSGPMPRELYLTFSCSPLRDEEGVISGILVGCTESPAAVLARRHAATEEDPRPRLVQPKTGSEEAGDQLLAESESRLRAIIDFAPAAIYVKDLCFHYMTVNRHLLKIMGRSREQIEGRDDYALFPKEAADRFRASDKEVLASGVPLEREEDFCLEDGTHTYLTVKFPLIDDLGNLYGLAGISTDMTERKRGEEELARSNRELEQFAYIVSHDLREPLRTIGGFLHLIQRRYAEHLDQHGQELIHFAMDGAERLDRLITDLLEYSRVQRQEPVLGPVDLFDIWLAVIDNLKALIEESGAHISHDPLPVVTGDASQLSRLLQNLIGNAIKFRGDRVPEIRLGISRRDHEWLFALRDNGIGVPPQYAERIFQVFQRLHTQKEYPGTGIGLAICKKIVERHGGRIWVESQPGQGTIFYFTLADPSRNCDHVDKEAGFL